MGNQCNRNHGVINDGPRKDSINSVKYAEHAYQIRHGENAVAGPNSGHPDPQPKYANNGNSNKYVPEEHPKPAHYGTHNNFK